MGRLSAYAKNRILKLRFKKNKRIIHIVEILKRDDNIKVSRQAVSTFLKKYLETNSIYDKPRTGRKRKLTHEEIQLIGQVTRLNRDITARAIKEYLNLNVSTYTILRATKLFEWNKSNESKLDDTGSPSRSKSSPNRVPRKYTKRKSQIQTAHESDDMNQSADLNDFSLNNDEDEIEKIQIKPLTNQEMNKKLAMAAAAAASGENLNQDNHSGEIKMQTTPIVTKTRQTANSIPDFEKVDLNMIEHKELLILKNLSCSPMSFATKILFKIFKIEELHGHNVSGKTLNKNLKAKLPLDPIRIGYIKFLVEKYYDEKECKEMLHGATSTKQDLWKSCHTAINKSILISERKAAMANQQQIDKKKPEQSDKKEDEKKAEDGKKRRRSYSSSSSEGEFDENLESEEFDSCDNGGEDDEDEIEMFKNQSINRRIKKVKTKKSNNSQSDESNESDSDEYGNEIELIQNIENRLVNPKEPDEKEQEEKITEEDFKNDEALAAANIAAAMKKRFVVVAPNNESDKSDTAKEENINEKNTEKKPVRQNGKTKKAEEEVEIKTEKDTPEEPVLVMAKRTPGRPGRKPKEPKEIKENVDKEKEVKESEKAKDTKETDEKDDTNKTEETNDRIQTRRSTRNLNKSVSKK
ncbi:unnamed protein product [Brachionus calyciflorus]|uniref:BEN domain-containing protein n=1 Tax=Brachionus calyciflorus TaxID=104777 RepID=A0A813XDV1_9BILA|nr:unnamed protein product [Brachionus calyciflorus]